MPFFSGTALLLFLAIYLPVIRLNDILLDTQAILFILAIGIALLRGRFLNLFVLPAGSLALILVGLIAYGLMIAMASPDSPSVHVALRPFRSLITLVGILALVQLALGRVRPTAMNAARHLARPLLAAISLHGAIMILQFISLDFRDLIYQYTVDPMVNSGARYYYSMAGLANGGGSQLSIFQSLGVLLLPIVLSGESANRRVTVTATILALICLFSVAITGRSGLLSVTLFYPLTCILLHGLAQGIRQILVHAGIVAVMAWLVFSAVGSYSPNESANFKERTYVDGLAAVATRVNEEIEEQTTVTILADHWTVPDSASGLIFGDPRHAELSQNSDERELKSDIGYVRILFSYGIIGTSLHLAFYVIIICYAVSRMATHEPAVRGAAAFACIASLVVITFNLKEVLFFSRMGLSITCISVAALMYSRKAERERESIAKVSATTLAHDGGRLVPRDG